MKLVMIWIWVSILPQPCVTMYHKNKPKLRSNPPKLHPTILKIGQSAATPLRHPSVKFVTAGETRVFGRSNEQTPSRDQAAAPSPGGAYLTWWHTHTHGEWVNVIPPCHIVCVCALGCARIKPYVSLDVDYIGRIVTGISNQCQSVGCWVWLLSESFWVPWDLGCGKGWRVEASSFD